MSDAEDDVEPTIWAGRLRPWPAAASPAEATGGEHEPDDGTLIARRRGVADDTVIAPRRSGAGGALPPLAPDVDETVIGARRAFPSTPDAAAATSASAPVEEDTVIRPGRPAAPAQAPPAALPETVEATQLRPPTRREASGRAAAPAGDTTRARVPDPSEREIYRPRAAEPAMIARSTPRPVPGLAAGDAAPATPRRARRATLLWGVVALGVLAVVAAGGVLLLVL